MWIDANGDGISQASELRTLFLPTLRGYGTIADLHIAMSMDKTGAGNLMGRVSA